MPPRRKLDIDIDDYVDRFSWDVFYTWFRWDRDQSVSVVGAIGSGKTTLIIGILPKQPSVAVLATKPRDRMYTYLIEHDGYKRIPSWPKGTPVNRFPNPGPRVIVWPEVENLTSDNERIAKAMRETMERIYATGAKDKGDRLVVIDEAWTQARILGLAKPMTQLILQGRAMGIPVLAGAQRASWVPREMWSEVTHIFMFATRDNRDLLTLRDLGGKVDPEILQHIVKSLRPEQHECLYVNRISGRMAIVTAPKVA